MLTEKSSNLLEWRYDSLENKEMEPGYPVHMKTYQSYTYRKELSWLSFVNEPSVQEGQQVKSEQSYKHLFVAYPTYTRSTSPDMATAFHERPYGRLIEIKSNLKRKKLHRINQGPNFLGGGFSNGFCRAPTQFRRGRQSQHLKS